MAQSRGWSHGAGVPQAPRSLGVDSPCSQAGQAAAVRRPALHDARQSRHTAATTQLNQGQTAATPNPYKEPRCTAWRGPHWPSPICGQQPFLPDSKPHRPPLLSCTSPSPVPASGLWYWPRLYPGTHFPQAFTCLGAPLPQAATQMSLPALSGTTRPSVLCSAVEAELQLGAQGGQEGTRQVRKACGTGHADTGLAAKKQMKLACLEPRAGHGPLGAEETAPSLRCVRTALGPCLCVGEWQPEHTHC